MARHRLRARRLLSRGLAEVLSRRALRPRTLRGQDRGLLPD